jgi:hypothetical protein
VTLPSILTRLRELPCLRWPFTAANRCDAPPKQTAAMLRPTDPGQVAKFLSVAPTHADVTRTGLSTATVADSHV